MLWIESHVDLKDHLKTRRAVRALGIPTAHVIGHLHLLWHWTMQHAEDGDLSALDAADIADAAEWAGDPDAFVGALRSSGFLNADGTLHDWHDYAGKLLEKRRRDRERHRSSGEVPRNSIGTPTNSGEVPAHSEATVTVTVTDTVTVPKNDESASSEDRIQSASDEQTGADAPPQDPDSDLAPPTNIATKRRKPVVHTADGWNPNDGHRLFAEQHRLDFAGETWKFRNHVPNAKNPYRDLDRAFNTWLHNAANWGAERGRGRSLPPGDLRRGIL